MKDASPQEQTPEGVEAQAAAHAPHTKHLELGLDPDNLGDTDRTPVDDELEIELIWANSTTVEQYKADIEELAGGGGA